MHLALSLVNSAFITGEARTIGLDSLHPGVGLKVGLERLSTARGGRIQTDGASEKSGEDLGGMG